jgi:hypothetical protein
MANRLRRGMAAAARVTRVLARPCLRSVHALAWRLGLWRPASEVAPEQLDAFVRLNAPHWSEAAASVGGTILVEGHLAQYGPNYLARTAVAARTLQARHGLNVAVVLPGYPHEWLAAERAYRSFGIQRFEYLKSQGGSWRSLWESLVSLVYAARVVLGLGTPSDVLSIELGGIPAGDLIYDDVMRAANVPTLRNERLITWWVVARALGWLASYRRLLGRLDVRYLVSTHSAYCEYGLLVRAALAHGAVVVETTDSLNSVHRELTRDKLPTYHQGVENMLSQEMARLSDADCAAICAEARAQLKERLAGLLNQVDVALAYKGKRAYGENELRQRLGIADRRPIVFIFAHAFIDSPHISSRQIHNDYHHWLRETLTVVAGLSNCHWVVKPHPSAALYGEQGKVEAMVAACDASNVWTSPADLSPVTVVEAARCVVTVQGTVALEYACKGVPAIVTGQAFYSGFGFTLQPTTVQGYADVLANAHRLAPLAHDAVERALLVYGLWNRLAGYRSDLIDQSVLRKIWGYEGLRSLDEAYALVNERLATRSFHELDVVRFIQDVEV